MNSRRDFEMNSRGDFEMQSMQMYALKQTMLSQETVFQKQVLELHRLYGIQKTMMQSIGCYDYGGHDLRIAREMSNLFPRSDPARNETLATERNFFSKSGVSLEQSINMHPCRPFDLRLSADQCIIHVGEDLSSSDEHFNLPFEILDKKRRKEAEIGILFGKKSLFLSENLINLEESIEGAAETATPPDRTTLENIYRDEHISLGISDFGQINSCIVKNSMTKEESKSFDAGLLDLNEAYPDDSSCNSNDPIATQNHSPESSPDFSGGISVNPIGPLRSRSGNLEYSDDQTKEPRKETIDLLLEPKSGNFNDNNCMGQKNDAESVVEEDEDAPAVMKNTPILSLSACDQFSRPEIGAQVSKTSTISAEEEWILSHRIESKDKIIDKNEVSAEVDPSIQNAAILLINMSTENSSHDTNYCEPQCSSDSFEMIALKLKENIPDEYSVSSRPIEMNNGDKRDYSFRLRRGRRLKDFQKEILPGLATLSRHEICEDINILEAVLRSREYKKVRANTEDRNKWLPPVRGKRSSVRRRLLL